ncbi:dihydroxyacetone kinase subunit L [Pseudoflavonifractor sp. AF19-9AC]|uniref:dihydroxyacetone kinase subunit DhaL n=1 Tax=Pseudoflavonifractor sp. AF19-9AC TaxID=2292244 RepID=UPI000E491F7C|nr:dihydroxyacetone kinase subunit DhaL [Pseudoflavonifractor sp. AF19-9AC]RHR06647.1 dihydroxyacetone kinase subunit L [Pseudoflavonifractor sp. AF19-9AC]
MSISFGSKEYMDYCQRAAELIAQEKDYITELDAVTGDGDHWANLNMGFQKVVEAKDELSKLPLNEMFKKIGMLMMSGIGGSSGVLYGSGYISAAKEVGTQDNIDVALLSRILMAMLEGICKRGNSGPGMKTMIDTLYAAANELKEAVEEGAEDRDALVRMERAAYRGMESTKEMEAIRGRAYYQAEKGVGHLDPGAVTMYYQLKVLSECMLEQC